MNGRNFKGAFLGFVLAASCAAPLAVTANEPEFEPPVAVNVEGLPLHVRERILTEAQKGKTAVIRYLHRTQSVHQLRPQFVIRQPEGNTIVTKDEATKVAASPAEARK